VRGARPGPSLVYDSDVSTVTQIKRNDTAPALTSVLGVDLTGATVAMLMRDDTNGEIKVDLGAATITDAATGTVSYAWQAGDTDTAGMFYVEWVVTFGDGTKRSLPVQGFDRVLIFGDLDDA